MQLFLINLARIVTNLIHGIAQEAVIPTLPTISAEHAFTEIKDEVDAVPESELVPINVDLANACAIGLATADLLDPLLPEMTELPGFDYDRVVKLRTYALAALYANAVYTASLNDRAVATLLEEATPLRENLLIAAEALAHRDILSAPRVAEIRSGQGHHDVADDLIALAALFREAWSAVKGKTVVTIEEVDRAAVLGSQLHAALGARHVGTDGPTGSQNLWKTRERAFSLFVHVYNECRRGVLYLRWYEDDADRYAPSFYRRRRRRPPEDEVTDEEDTDDTPTDPPAPDEPIVDPVPPTPVGPVDPPTTPVEPTAN